MAFRVSGVKVSFELLCRKNRYLCGMNRLRIITRPARVEDAPMIAQAVAMAIGDPVGLRQYCGEEYLAVLTEIARTEGSQYSWQNAIVAECESRVVGAVIGYDGAMLQQLRNGTLAVIQKMTEHLPSVVDETEAGEYYLDSVAVVPEFRGQGIGMALVRVFCERAFKKGFGCVGLIVDVANIQAERLYLSEGFVCVGERTFFGHRMRHLQKIR